MSSFRKYGGVNRSAIGNIVRHHYANETHTTISNSTGLNNSKILSQSHIDMSCNSILNLQSIYFCDGTTLSNGGLTGPTGPTGPAGVVDASGTYYSDYLYWNTAGSGAWAVGSAQVHLGQNAGQTSQGLNAVAIGLFAGYQNQNERAIALGEEAGRISQGSFAIAQGYRAGYSGQGTRAIALGQNAGISSQGSYAIALGRDAGSGTQGANAIAMGYQAGYSSQGANAIALGQNAGFSSQPANSIIINASGAIFSGTDTSACYITPIRNITGPRYLTYDPTSSEITWSAGAPSDYRIKENVRPITGTIDELRPLAYYNTLTQNEDMGIIAHELQEHFPALVFGEKDGEINQSVNYNGLVALLIKEVQDLKKEIKEIKSNMSLAAVQP